MWDRTTSNGQALRSRGAHSLRQARDRPCESTSRPGAAGPAPGATPVRRAAPSSDIGRAFAAESPQCQNSLRAAPAGLSPEKRIGAWTRQERPRQRTMRCAGRRSPSRSGCFAPGRALRGAKRGTGPSPKRRSLASQDSSEPGLIRHEALLKERSDRLGKILGLFGVGDVTRAGQNQRARSGQMLGQEVC